MALTFSTTALLISISVLPLVSTVASVSTSLMKSIRFSTASLESYRSAPITIGHPETDVNTENAKELIKGVLEGMPMKDESGEMLIGTLVINDADTIALVRANTNQLSSGHTASLVMCDFDTVGYHAKKTNIRANHIAIVPKGRAGVAAIEDSAEELEEVVEEQETAEVVPEVL